MVNKQENTGQILFYLLLLMVSIAYLLSAIPLGAPVVDAQLKPSFFPLIIGSLALTFSSILLLRTLKERRAAKPASDDPAATPGDRRPYLVMLATALYVLAFTQLGYLASSLLYVFAIMIIFSNTEKWLSKLVIAALIVGLGYLLFEQLFGVRLPSLLE